MIATIAVVAAAAAPMAMTPRARANAVPAAEMVRLALNLDARARDHIGLRKYDEAIGELGSAQARLRDAAIARPRPRVLTILVTAKRFETKAIVQLRSEPPHPLLALAAIRSADVAAKSALARLSP